MIELKSRVVATAGAMLLSVAVCQPAAAQSASTHPVMKQTETVFRSRSPQRPPADKAEMKPAQPSDKDVWMPGRWNFDGSKMSAPDAGWVWIPGKWIEPPMAGARWDPGHWGWQADGWYSWIPSHWDMPTRHDWV